MSIQSFFQGHRAATILLFLLSVVASSTSIAQQTRPPNRNTTTAPAAPVLTRIESLGQRLFTDRNLSEPAGTACISCHSANTGFANNHGSGIGVALGSKPSSLGLRNAMNNAYQRSIPAFIFQSNGTQWKPIGGHFWDGRADTLALQALGPLLAPLEMNNADAASVVRKVAAAPYANLMREEFGALIFEQTDLAFQKIGAAIAAFENTRGLQSFSSKYDAVLQGQASFNASESRGQALFVNPNKGNCIACHSINLASKNPQEHLFSDFSYHALAIPRNKAIPQNASASFFDLGLCGPVRDQATLSASLPAGVKLESLCGKFRTPSLRNVGLRMAFMHNGFFKDLREVLAFYASRDIDPRRWYGAAGVADDMPAAYRANIVNDRLPFGLKPGTPPAFSAAEAADLMAFLRTLNDGFLPPPPAGAPPANSLVNPFGR